MRVRSMWPLVLAAVVAGARDAAAQRPAQWRLSEEPVLRIGVVEGETAYQFFDAVSSVRLGDGRIAVLNAGSHELRIFDANGRIVANVGRKGQGPGEFSRPSRIYRMAADSLKIYDVGNRRFSIHAPDGTFVRSEPIVEQRAFFLDEWLYDRSWIDGPALGRGRGVVRAAIDRLPPPDPKVGYRYVEVSPQGHLWVRQPGEPGGPVDWIIYDLEAWPIGRITTPAGFQIHEIGRDYLLGVGRDDMDVEYVEFYTLEGAERAPTRVIADDEASDAPPARTLPAETLNLVRATLKNLAVMQEVYYSSGNFRYAGNVEQLDGWEPPKELLIQIVNASPRGWTGIIIDRKTGATCGMSYGAVVPVGWAPGTVLCEGASR